MKLSSLSGPWLALWVARALVWDYQIVTDGGEWQVTLGGVRFDPEHDENMLYAVAREFPNLVVTLQTDGVWAAWATQTDLLSSGGAQGATSQLAILRAVVFSAFPGVENYAAG